MNFLLVIQLIGLLFCSGSAQKSLNQTLIVEKGEKVTLPCLVAETIESEEDDEEDSEAVLWIRNGTSMISVDKHLLISKNDANIRLENDNFTLVIKNFSSSLNGLYTCRLGVTLDSITYNVRVKEPPLVLSIEGDRVIDIGDNLNLTCITSGFPAPNITWYRQKTTSLPRQRFHNGGNIFLENVDAGVSATYTCIASYDSIEDSKSVNVVIFHGLEAEFESVHVEPPGEDTKLCCLLNKTKEINWLKQGRNITFDDRITEETTKHKSCLVIREVVFQDLGTYLCRTKNLLQLATIDLTGIPKQPLLISSTNNSLTWKVVNSAFPILEYSIFVKPAGDIHGSWRFVTNEKIADTDEKETKEFIIPYTFFTLSSGRYDVKLEVSNRINANQVINYDALDIARAQKTLNQTLIVEKGETVTLPCLVAETIVREEDSEEDSEPVIWIRNGTSISVDNLLLVSKNEVDNIRLESANFILVIKNFSSSLNGLYTCRLNSTLDSITYNVRVKEPPFVLSIEGDTVIEIGDNLNLTCITSGFPAPNITWYRQKTTSLPRQSFHNEGNIFFEKINPGVAGEYTCVASYDSIEDSKSVTVVVFQGLEAEYESVHVEPSREDTKLCCLLNKTKEINWSKLGRNIIFDDHITEETTKHKSCLVIREVVFDDLGTYLCRTKNLLQLATIDLTGIPKQPRLISSTNNSLTWKVVNSAFPILEYSIFVKPAGDIHGSWRFVTNEKIAGTNEKETKEFLIPYTFFTLSPGRYDVKLEVSNRINANHVINYDTLDAGVELFNGANSFKASVLCLWMAVVVIIFIRNN